MQAYLNIFLAWFLHLDTHLLELVHVHGNGVYLILFAVIFIETGVVIMPFLPGDSLLFIAGAVAAKGLLNPLSLFAILTCAAVSGDAVNFAVGTWFRRKTLDTSKIPFVKPEHLAQTHDFFKAHGGKTVILARFVPIVRTLAPFVAALGAMPPRIFFTYNLIGAVLWIGGLLLAGYVFGGIPWVNHNLTVVVLGIVALSMMPAVIAWLRTRRASGARD